MERSEISMVARQDLETFRFQLIDFVNCQVKSYLAKHDLMIACLIMV
jgi:hypothetical protein